MARYSSDQVRLKNIDKKWKATEVVVLDSTWMVVYKGKIIKASRRNELTDDYANRHYYNTSFPHQGHAQRFADRLNKMFNTTDFTIKEVTL